MICSALGVEVDLKHFSDAEMGFDTEAMKVEGQAAKKAALELAAGTASPGSDGEDGRRIGVSPIWPHRAGGLDPPR